MRHGAVAGFPVKGVRVRLQDGQYHSVDSSEQAFRMAGSIAMREAMASGPVAGFPVKDVRVRLVDGSYHSVDSSEMAFKLAGSIAMKEAMSNADAALLEPIMLVTVSVPEESVGDVIGDLNSRRGRPQGMEPAGGMTEIKAEVPMAELLSYAPDLRSLTGGQGDYTMEFLRYEEVPSHLAAKVVQQTAEEAVTA
jgi:elongation factor G